MSDLPSNIDAILASIRSRMNDDGTMAPLDVPEPEPADTAPPALPAPVTGIAQIAMTSSAMTLEDVVRSMLEPLIKGWLDAHMPEIVETLAQAEIKRLTGRE